MAKYDWETFGFHIPKIMVPKQGTDYGKWAVVACDQYTSEPEYWEEVEKIVEKRVENGRTYTSVLRLSDQQRRMEIARLTGGSVLSDTILAGADELLRAARQQRESGG